MRWISTTVRWFPVRTEPPAPTSSTGTTALARTGLQVQADFASIAFNSLISTLNFGKSGTFSHFKFFGKFVNNRNSRFRMCRIIQQGRPFSVVTAFVHNNNRREDVDTK